MAHLNLYLNLYHLYPYLYVKDLFSGAGSHNVEVKAKLCDRPAGWTGWRLRKR